MTEKIKKQILAVHDQGVRNMFDLPKVMDTALRLGFFELAAFLKSHRPEYMDFIFTGNTGDCDV